MHLPQSQCKRIEDCGLYWVRTSDLYSVKVAL